MCRIFRAAHDSQPPDKMPLIRRLVGFRSQPINKNTRQEMKKSLKTHISKKTRKCLSLPPLRVTSQGKVKHTIAGGENASHSRDSAVSKKGQVDGILNMKLQMKLQK